jgi:hypothetical protein
LDSSRRSRRGEAEEEETCLGEQLGHSPFGHDDNKFVVANCCMIPPIRHCQDQDSMTKICDLKYQIVALPRSGLGVSDRGIAKIRTL